MGYGTQDEKNKNNIYIYIYIYTIGNESLQIVSKLILILVWKFIWLYKRCLSIWFYELMGHNKNIMSLWFHI